MTGRRTERGGKDAIREKLGAISSASNRAGEKSKWNVKIERRFVIFTAGCMIRPGV